jgi:PAS domain S-box-containing protein
MVEAMSAELRKSGIDIIGDIPWGTHFCQFYRTASDLLDILVPYFAAGLEANEFCMWITSEPVGKEAAKRALAEAVPDLDRRLRAGQIEFLGHDEWYLAEGRFDANRVLDAWAAKLKDARARGFDGLRLTGNTFWLEKADWDAFTAYEAAVNESIGQSLMLALCTYSLDRCGAEEILDVVRNHRFALVRRGSRWEVMQGAGSALDATMRKQAESALRESEAKYRSLFERMTDGFALYELVEDDQGMPLDWRVLEVNEAYTRQTGISRAKIVGRRISELFPAVYAEYLPTFARVVATQQPAEFETYAKAVDRTMHVVTFPVGGRRFASLIEDISERRKAEGALTASEERYRALFNNMTEGFALHEIITDEADRPLDYRFIDINPAFERLTGLGRSGVVGRRVREVLPDIEPHWIEAYGRVALTGEPLTFERYYPEPLNRWFEIYAYRPAPRHFAVVFMDISPRKRTEAALRESEKRLERSQEIAHLGSWELDLAADRLTWSDEVFRIFGLRPQEFAATYEAFLAAVHPSDRDAVDEAYRESLREGRDSYEIEHRIVRPDTGEVRTVHEKCEHFRDAAGRIVRSVGMVHDITERKRAESLRQALVEQERLRLGAAVEQASEAVIMADPEGRILYVNAAFEKIRRLGKDEAPGRDYFGLVGGDQRSAEIRSAVSRGEAWNGRVVLARQGERPVTLEVAATPIPEPPGILITERDITGEVLLQEQVRQAQKLEALGTLAGGVAHDFNNILGAIIINTELALLDSEEDCPARESLPLILKAAERGKELVKQIVSYSRKQEWERSPLRPAPLVREGIRLLRATFPESVRVDETIVAEDAAVLAHPAQIHQILSNLCQNAALAMRGQPGRLEVRLDTCHVDADMASRHAGLGPGPYVRLTVTDSGCGMPPEVLDRIFEPFFTTRKPGEGSGLGLSVVHGIVRSAGGAITAYSEVGKGSTFNVFLPLHEEAGLARPPSPGSEVSSGSERILLVDDDPAQLRSLARMLEKLGYKVTARSSGRTAGAAFKKDPRAFDLVITDQTMPRMSGLELARSLIKIRPEIPIILNTGFSEKVNGDAVGRDGIRGFLMKPFSIGELSALIRKVLESGL